MLIASTVRKQNETKCRLHALQMSQQVNYVRDVRTRKLRSGQHKIVDRSDPTCNNWRIGDERKFNPAPEFSQTFNRRPMNPVDVHVLQRPAETRTAKLCVATDK